MFALCAHFSKHFPTTLDIHINGTATTSYADKIEFKHSTCRYYTCAFPKGDKTQALKGLGSYIGTPFVVVSSGITTPLENHIPSVNI